MSDQILKSETRAVSDAGRADEPVADAPVRAARLRNLIRTPGMISVVIGGTITLLFVLAAVFAAWLAPDNPDTLDLTARLKPPAWSAGGSAHHLLGTDALGRDVLSRLLYGSRISLLVGVAAVVCAGILGVAIGVVSAYRGGWLDYAVQRIVELFQAFPFILLAITVMAFLGQSVRNIILVLVLTRWVQFCRVARAEVLSLKSRDYIVAASTMGSSGRRTMLRHIVPNVAAPVIVVATFSLAFAILGEAGLSYLGVGVPPNIPTWGTMLSGGQQYMFTDQWLTVMPGLLLFILVLAVNILGDGLRDMNDPKMRGSR
jgi:peptide/nickel transport system permease protein